MAKCTKCNENDALASFEVCIGRIQKALDKPDIIVNDLLAYANSYRGACSKTKLFNACLHEFKDTEIYDAKKLLFTEYQKILGTPVDRRDENRKNSSLKDIFKALDELVDREQVSVICASINVKAIPRYNPEELEDSSMIQRIINVEKRIEQHSIRLDEYYARVADTQNEIEASTRSINNIQNDVQTSMKIANEAKECVDTHKNDVDDFINKIDTGIKPTFAKVAEESRSNVQNDGNVIVSESDDAGGPWHTAGRRRFNARNVVNGNRPSSSTAGGVGGNTVQRSHTDRRQSADSNLQNRNTHRRSPYRYGST